MPIDHNNKFIFVHIPKTAGTSIERMYGLENPRCFFNRRCEIIIDNVKYCPQHLTSTQLKTRPEISQYYNEYYKFSFVRNPYDRVLSEFFWREKKIVNYEYFKKWIYQFYSKIDMDHKLTQYEYVYENSNLVVDFLGKVENLEEDFKKIQNNLGIPNKPLLRSNISLNNQIDKKSYLTSEIKDFIYNLYKVDFETFEYEK